MKASKSSKSLPVRLDNELHKFFKVYACANDTDMTSILVEYIKKLKKGYEKELTHKDVHV